MAVVYLHLSTRKLRPEVKWIILVTARQKEMQNEDLIVSLFYLAHCHCLPGHRLAALLKGVPSIVEVVG